MYRNIDISVVLQVFLKSVWIKDLEYWVVMLWTWVVEFWKSCYFTSFKRVFCMGLEQCSLDTGPRTLGFSKSLILHWFYMIFWELVHYGFGALSCRALKMLLFHLFYKLVWTQAWKPWIPRTQIVWFFIGFIDSWQGGQGNSVNSSRR